MSDNTKADIQVVLNIIERGLELHDKKVPTTVDALKIWEERKANMERRKAIFTKDLEELNG